MITLRGAEVSAKLKEEVQEELKTLKRIPKLAIIRVGNRPDDISYENDNSDWEYTDSLSVEELEKKLEELSQ